MKHAIIPLAAMLLLAGCASPTNTDTRPGPEPDEAAVEQVEDETPENGAEEPAEADTEAPTGINIDVLGTGSDGMIIATYPVADGLTKGTIRRNLQDGCHQALTQVTQTVDNWHTYGLIQCVGNLDGGTLQVGAADYTGPQLQDINLNEVDAPILWQQSTQATINPHYE